MPTTWMDKLVQRTRRLSDMPFPHQAAFLLDNPVRRAMADPAGAVAALGLSGDERVLELGPGNGFYSVEAARLLTGGGRLELFDLQPQMLDKARRRLERAGFRDAGFRSGDAGAELPYDDSAFDVVFMAAVIGEVPDKRACLRSVARVLRPGGVLAFFEGFGDPDRFSAERLRELVEPEGFAFRDATGNRWRDAVRFTRIGTGA